VRRRPGKLAGHRHVFLNCRLHLGRRLPRVSFGDAADTAAACRATCMRRARLSCAPAEHYRCAALPQIGAAMPSLPCCCGFAGRLRARQPPRLRFCALQRLPRVAAGAGAF
jgi:hypothetical protein